MPNIIETNLYKDSVRVKLYKESHQYWRSIDGGTFKRVRGVTTFLGIKDKSRPLQIWQQQITADFLLLKIAEGIKLNEDLVLEAVIQNEVQSQAASDIGTEIHAWGEYYFKFKLKIPGYEDLPDIPKFPEAVTGVNGLLEWEKKRKVKAISSERLVYSKEQDYMGTMDLEAVIDGKYCNGNDFKASNGLYNSVLMQTAAYEKADREERKCKRTEARWAIRFSKYTEEEYMRREERKKELKRAIARIKHQMARDYPIPPYQVFEARLLDRSPKDLERDFAAFLHAKALFEWDKETDFFWADKKLNV